MGSKERSFSRKLFPLVDRQGEVVVDCQPLTDESGVETPEEFSPENLRETTISPEIKPQRTKGRKQFILSVAQSADLRPEETTLDAEKAVLQRRFELQVHGHRRRPTKSTRRTAGERAVKTRVRAVKEGTEQKVVAEQIDQGLGAKTPDSQNYPTSTVFIAASDLNRIRQILGNITHIELDTFEPDQEIKDVFDQDQSRAQSSWHAANDLLETRYSARNPYAPRDIIEEDYSEESRP